MHDNACFWTIHGFAVAVVADAAATSSNNGHKGHNHSYYAHNAQYTFNAVYKRLNTAQHKHCGQGVSLKSVSLCQTSGLYIVVS